MGGRGRRLTFSDSEDDAPPSPPGEVKKRRKVFIEEDEEEEEEEEEEEALLDENDEQEDVEDAKPVGVVIRVSGKGESRKNHYKAFEFDGLRYELEDPVLLIPEGHDKKPDVAIIKDITKTRDGGVMVTGQRFYRPDEAEKESGGNWHLDDARTLFYSFDCSEVPAENVMHTCLVHFIPPNKQIPNCRQHPGFVVQNVYDPESKRLSKLLDQDYEDHRQREIDQHIQKTLGRLPFL